MALIEIDIVGAEARQAGIDLLCHLRGGQPLIGVGHREEEFRREHIGVAGLPLQRVAEEALRGAATIDVRGVDEIDPGIKRRIDAGAARDVVDSDAIRSEEHTSELQALMRITYAVFFLQKYKNHITPA